MVRSPRESQNPEAIGCLLAAFIASRYQRFGESENLLIQGHDVEYDFPRVNPPAQGRSFTGVLGESERAKAFAKFSVLSVRGDFSDRVHITRRSRFTRGFICNEQAGDGSTRKHEVAKHGAQ